MKERAHLETSVNNLKIKHDKNQAVHKSDTTIIMKHNTFLIFEINHLKLEKKKILVDKAKQLMLAQQRKRADGTMKVDLAQLDKEIQKNEDEKRRLKQEIDQLHLQNNELKAQYNMQQGGANDLMEMDEDY